VLEEADQLEPQIDAVTFGDLGCNHRIISAFGGYR